MSDNKITKEDKIKANIGMSVETFSIITCIKCRETKTVVGDDFDAAEQLYNSGWHATEQNVYCPSCNKKRLKK